MTRRKRIFFVIVHVPRKLQTNIYCTKYCRGKHQFTSTVALPLTFSRHSRLLCVNSCDSSKQKCKRLTWPAAIFATAFLGAPLPSSGPGCMVSRLLPPGVHHDGLEPEMSASLDTRPIPTREMSGGDVGTPLGEVQKNTNRHSKRWVKEAFEHRPENAEKQATCRYCHKVRSTLNPTRQKEHLLNKKECQFLQSEDARMSTDPEVQSILAGGSLHPTPRRPKSEREPGASGIAASPYLFTTIVVMLLERQLPC